MEALIIVFVTALLGLFAALTKRLDLVFSLVIVGLLTALGMVVHEWYNPITMEYTGLIFGKFELGFSAIAIFLTLLIAILGTVQFTKNPDSTGDYLGLMLFSLCGAICLFAFTDMFMLFLGVEILSIPVYVLAGSKKTDLRSNEAALKYFLMGAFATGVLLFGIALVYGATGSFDISEIAHRVMTAGTPSIMFYTGMVFMLCGLFFKIGAAPFHFWSPDVYTGSPTIVTTYMATIVKMAAFVALFKVTHICFGMNSVFWGSLVAIVAALTITIGNVTAVFQNNFKRVLAYSSISHAGYLLLAILSQSSSEVVVFNLAFYLVSYSLATICAFAIFMRIKEAAGGNEGFESFNGLGKQQPFTATLMAICLLSMAGIPPMAGFFAKYYLFADAFADYGWLVIIAILNSAISIYYYFRPIIHMFFTETNHVPAAGTTIPLGFKTVIGITAIGAVVLGIISGWINVFTTDNPLMP